MITNPQSPQKSHDKLDLPVPQQTSNYLLKILLSRSINSLKATQPVPDNKILAANLKAKAWNSATELQTVTTIGAAKSVAQKWVRNLLVF